MHYICIEIKDTAGGAVETGVKEQAGAEVWLVSLHQLHLSTHLPFIHTHMYSILLLTFIPVLSRADLHLSRLLLHLLSTLTAFSSTETPVPCSYVHHQFQPSAAPPCTAHFSAPQDGVKQSG